MCLLFRAILGLSSTGLPHDLAMGGFSLVRERERKRWGFGGERKSKRWMVEARKRGYGELREGYGEMKEG